MKTFFALLFSSLSFAATTPTKILVDNQFTYKTQKNIVSVTKRIILEENNKSWMTFARSKNGVVLLGRLKGIKDNTLTVEYITVDPSREATVLNTPTIVTTFGEKATITADLGQGSTVTVTLLAKKN